MHFVHCFGLFWSSILGCDQNFWVATNNLTINQQFKNEAGWCKKKSCEQVITRSLVLPPFAELQPTRQSFPILSHSTFSLQKQPSWKWGDSKSYRSEWWGSLQFYTWGMSRSTVMKYRKSHQSLSVGSHKSDEIIMLPLHITLLKYQQ